MDFIAIDFETANAKRSSACSIGIAEVRNFEIVDVFEYYIKPVPGYFSHFNTELHGITMNHVRSEPTFDELWYQISHLFEDLTVLAHNASFDISVLRQALDVHGIETPAFQYGCTVQLSKKFNKQLYGHKLSDVARHYGIRFRHHNAKEDAEVCARIALNMFEDNDINSFDDLEHFGYKLKST